MLVALTPRRVVTLTPRACDAKLAPVMMVPTARRPRAPIAIGRFVTKAEALIEATSSDPCPFEVRGCDVREDRGSHLEADACLRAS